MPIVNTQLYQNYKIISTLFMPIKIILVIFVVKFKNTGACNAFLIKNIT